MPTSCQHPLGTLGKMAVTCWHGGSWGSRCSWQGHWVARCMTYCSKMLLQGHVFRCQLAHEPMQLPVLRSKLVISSLDFCCLQLFALAAELRTLPVALHAGLLHKRDPPS